MLNSASIHEKFVLMDEFDTAVELMPSREEVEEVELDELGLTNGLERKKNPKLNPRIISRNILAQYKHEIANHILLTEKEEAECSRIIRMGRNNEDEFSPDMFNAQQQRAINLLISSNLKLVLDYVRRKPLGGFQPMDLIQVGNLALWDAAVRFDSDKARFTTFATIWIRKQIDLFKAANAKMVVLPINKIDDIKNYKKIRYELFHELGREPSREEIAHRINWPMKKLEQLEILMQKEASMDKPIGEDSDDECNLYNFRPDTKQLCSEDLIFRKKQAIIIRKSFSCLSYREQLIVSMLYGIGFGQENEHLETQAKIIIGIFKSYLTEKEALAFDQNYYLKKIEEKVSCSWKNIRDKLHCGKCVSNEQIEILISWLASRRGVDYNLETIGTILDVSREAIRQTKEKILKKLKIHCKTRRMS